MNTKVSTRQANNKEHKRLNKKKMSLFKGENDTTTKKNSDNMLTMNQKNIPAVSLWMFTSFFRCCTFLLYFNFYLANFFFHFFFNGNVSITFFNCGASTLISRFVCQSIFTIATSSYMCRPQCLPNNCKFCT